MMWRLSGSHLAPTASSAARVVVVWDLRSYTPIPAARPLLATRVPHNCRPSRDHEVGKKPPSEVLQPGRLVIFPPERGVEKMPSPACIAENTTVSSMGEGIG